MKQQGMIYDEIVETDAGTVQWSTAQELATTLGQSQWLTFRADWHISNHLLVACVNNQVVGFLRFVVQPIGPDMDCPAVMVQNVPLVEAKILAFGVAERWRRNGIGRALQTAAIEHARLLDCYQVRSHSGGESAANHHLKMAMGFAIHPLVRGDDRHGCYFLLPLRGNVS